MIENTKLVCVWALAMGIACGNKGGDASSGAANDGAAQSGEASDAKTGDAKTGDAKTAADSSVPMRNDICKAFDKDAVAGALGWEGLSKVSGVGGSAKGIRHRHCGFTGKNANTEQHFGVTFSTAQEFEAEHVGFAAKYEPRAAVGGHETRVARNDRVVILQMKTPQMLVTVDAAETGKTPAELEPKLEAAAIALVGSLPPDAKAILEKKKE
jgi:hypothetical protein